MFLNRFRRDKDQKSGNRSGGAAPPIQQQGGPPQSPNPPQSPGRAPPQSPRDANAPGSPQQRATPLFLCKPFVTSQLVKGSFSTIVVLPKYVDEGEWLALNVFEFFNMLNQFYGVIRECCTQQSCPTMSAGPKLDYTWLDANKKPLRLPAPTYIEYVLQWMSNRINDENLFPTKAAGLTTASTAAGAGLGRIGSSAPGDKTWVGKDGGFPDTFFNTCKTIYVQMFRVFAHIYHTHFHEILHLSLEAHFNSFFVHFIHFGRHFVLLDEAVQQPLKPLIDAFEAQGLFADNASSKSRHS